MGEETPRNPAQSPNNNYLNKKNIQANVLRGGSKRKYSRESFKCQ